MKRQYDLEVVAKYQGTHGYGNIMLRPPQIDGAEVYVYRPWWFDRTVQGAPLTVDLGPEEMAGVDVGTLFRVTLEQMTTVGDEIARRAEG